MRIYLAGPEVFLPEALAIGAAKKALCARHGWEGVFPMDPPALSPSGEQDWRRIHAANELLLRGCDALVANLTPFRGVGADPGTVFELGFMRALGRPVHGYTHDPRPHRARVPEARLVQGIWEDAQGMRVEDHGLAENLMLEGAIRAGGGVMLRAAVALPWTDLSLFERCLEALALPSVAGFEGVPGLPGGPAPA
ncbi:nucleoside 2-deoxyribosyltransferase [Roseococcus microcysteis]|uniref:nucleoside 2-deoxyribosyltransferase n=1 Tax=Roseococcus microcysteis TaxID=2771361 RepID=UPI00168A76B3|nr:nucleoside 2-deoxyribosyltransferase [Roseococcus microcysteis]